MERAQILKDFHTHLSDLMPEVREKAIEYAIENTIQQKVVTEEIIKECIMRAETWYLSRQG